MLPSRIRPLIALALICSGAGLAAVFPVAAGAAPGDDDTPVLLTPKGEHEDGSDEASFDKLRDAYYWSRLLSGDDQLTVNQAAALRSKAVAQADGDRERPRRRRRARRRLDQPGPEPDRAGRPHHQHLRGGRRDGSARWPSATTARSSSAPPRAASGPTTPPPAPGRRAPTTPTPSRSARWRSRRATTRSSTWAPARARCPATATTATASTGRPTAA